MPIAFGHSVPPAKPWKKAAFSQYPRSGGMGYTLRSDKWRYTEWRSKSGDVTDRELYDHSPTDVATANLVDDPKYAEVRQAMAALLQAGPEAATPAEN